MAAWLRREHEPDKSLTDARKELVHSYMDAEESEARRQAIERLERQSHTREQARPLAAEEAVRRGPPPLLMPGNKRPMTRHGGRACLSAGRSAGLLGMPTTGR